MKIKSDAGAEMLAQAIVKQAVADYQKALQHISRYEKALQVEANDDTKTKLDIEKDTKKECEKFFYSEYCFSLTGASGDYLIKLIHKKSKSVKKEERLDDGTKIRNIIVKSSASIVQGRKLN